MRFRLLPLASVFLLGSLSFADDPAAPPSSIGGVTETLNGHVVRDPFRGLEDRAAAASWIDAHTAKADAWFAAHPDEALDQRLMELSSLGGVGGPRVVGAKTFFTRSDGVKEQPVLVVREGGAERALFDPMAVDATGKTSMDDYVPSQTGAYVAYLTSPNGSEESVLHVLETATGKDTGLSIPDTRWSGITWLPDDSGFYYSRYPHGLRYDQRLWFHKLGDDPAKDAKAFGDGRAPTDNSWAAVSEDGKDVAFVAERGWTATDVYVENRATGKRTTVAEGLENKVLPLRVAEGAMYALTNLKAPKFRLVKIDLASPKTETWTDVRPEGKDTLEFATWAGSRWVLKVLDEDAVARVLVLGADGKPGPTIALPELGGVPSIDADWRAPRTAIAFSSFGIKSAIYEFDASADKPALSPVAVVTAGAAPTKLSIRRERYLSYDGTKIPIWIVEKAGVAAAGPRPVYLYAYGGFAVTLEPTFSTRALAWVEKGGVYALANLRGGNEFGEAWHQAGMHEKKFQVFDDMEYAMRYLEGEGIATPATMGIEGGSNGGLLMGAMMTRCPHLFSACVGAVGLYDMIRFQKWPPAELWTDEYGSSDDASQIGYLLAYSPYHNIIRGAKYPAFLAETAEEDTRVTWRHSAKFVAALEAANAGSDPVFFRMEQKAGHGQGKNRTDAVKDYSRTLRFLWANTAGSKGK